MSVYVSIINLDTFDNYQPSGNVVGTEIGDTNYDPKAGSVRAREHTVRKVVNKVLAANDTTIKLL